MHDQKNINILCCVYSNHNHVTTEMRLERTLNIEYHTFSNFYLKLKCLLEGTL